MPGILYKQNYDGGRNAIPPPREGRHGIGHSGQKATSVFPSTHHLHRNAVSCASHVSKADFTGRIWKWGEKIGALDIKYLPRTAIKRQVLADFVAEFTPTLEQKDLSETTFQENSSEDLGLWKVYVDGASNAKGLGTRVVIIMLDETVIELSIRLDFKASNNEAEYEAVMAELNSTKTLGAKHLVVYCDSLLIASQINGEYMARDERMVAYLLKVQQTMTNFKTVRVE